jgi:hypothetical protein
MCVTDFINVKIIFISIYKYQPICNQIKKEFKTILIYIRNDILKHNTMANSIITSFVRACC